VIEEILDLYPVDGFHLNAAGFPGYCYCENCRRRFREELNADIPLSPSWDDELWKDFILWRYRCVTECVGNLKTRIEGCGSAQRSDERPLFLMQELISPLGEGARRRGQDLERLSPHYSVVLIAVGDATNRQSYAYTPGVVARYAQNLQPDDRARTGSVGGPHPAHTESRSAVPQPATPQPPDPVMNIKLSISMDWDRGKVPEHEYRYWIYQSIASGAGLKLAMSGSFEQEDRRDVLALKEALTFLEIHCDYYSHTEPVTPVAVVLSRRTADFYGRDDPAERYLHNVKGMCEALVAEHIPYTVISDAGLTRESLARFQTIVLTNTACLDRNQAEAIERFVYAGGSLLATLETGLYDERGRHRSEGLLNGVLGIRQIGNATVEATRSYMQSVEDRDYLFVGCGDTNMLHHGLRHVPVQATDNGQALMHLASHRKTHPRELIDRPEVLDTPLAVSHNYGSGMSLYFAHEPERLYFLMGLEEQRRLIGNAVRRCTANLPFETDAPSTVEMTLTRTHNAHVLHLVNATGKHPLDGIISVQNIQICFAPDFAKQFRAARCLLSAQRLKIEATPKGTDSSVEVTVPMIEAYEAIVLE
jgi:hypothetical protein